MTFQKVAGYVAIARAALSCILVFVSLTCSPLFGTELAKEWFDIPADKAENSLKSLSEESGVEVLFPTDVVAGVRTNAVRGVMAPREALAAMLVGTGLVGMEGGKTGSLTVRRESAEETKNGVPPPVSSRAAANASTGFAVSGDNLGAVVALSPFEVSDQGDKGYESAVTLSGTRLRTSLNDVASSVSVYNKTFMDDLNAHDLSTLLNYTLGTEVGGLSGNFSAATIATGFFGLTPNQPVATPNQTNRVRGLLAADQTQDFFLSIVQTDDYDIDRVEISRGANAMLYGLGSPAGIINTTRITAQTGGNFGEIRETTGSYGSNRGVVDDNLVLIKDMLAFRFAATDNDQYYQIKDAYEKKQKLYLTATYQPFKNTTIKVSTESAKDLSDRPESSPPFDEYTQYWQLGKPSYNPATGNLTLNAPITAPGIVSPSPIGTSANPNLIYPDAKNDNILAPGFVTNNFGPSWGVIYSNQNSGVPSIPGYPGVIGMQVWQTGEHVGNGGWQLGPTTGLVNDSLVTLRFPNRILVQEYANSAPQDANYWQFPELSNPNIYNFFNNQLDGSIKYEWSRWTTYNATLQQTFLNNHAGIELAFNRELVNYGLMDPESFWGYALQIDINSNLLNGAPNPNYGRAFVNAGTANMNSTEDNRDTQRETAFYDLDFRDLPGPSWLKNLLGHHILTLTNSYFKHYTESHDGDPMVATVDYDMLANGTSPTTTGIDPNVLRTIGVIQYMGPSQVNSSMPGYIPPTTVRQWPSDYTSATILYAPQATPTQTMPSQWGTLTTGVLTPDSQYAVNNGTDFYASKHLDRFSSTSFVVQDYLFYNDVVTTFGWRNDQYRSYDAGTPPYNPVNGSVITNATQWPLAPTGSGGMPTFSYGLVGHTPDFIRRRLPLGMDISVIYNHANNFQPTGQRFDVFGNPVNPVSGITREEGARVAIFGGRFDIKFAHYKSSEALTTNGSLSNVISELADNFQDVLQSDNSSNPTSEAALLAFLNSPAGQQYSKVFQFQFGSPNPAQGNLPTFQSDNANNGQIVGTSDLTSMGYEYEVGINPLPNWRVAFNANEAEAVTTNSGAQLTQLFNNSIIPLLNGPAGSLMETTGGYITTFKANTYSDSVLPLQTVQLQDGTATQELRKWHWNLVTNYDFPHGPFKGWGVGGAVRWMDKIAIGYPIINDPIHGPIPDLNNPYYGPSEVHYDAWISYRRNFGHNIVWKAQLNLQSIGVGNRLIPILAQPNGQIADWRIDQPMTWAVSNTLNF